MASAKFFVSAIQAATENRWLVGVGVIVGLGLRGFELPRREANETGERSTAG